MIRSVNFLRDHHALAKVDSPWRQDPNPSINYSYIDMKHAKSFEKWVCQLEKFRLLHGHCKIPSSYVDADGYKLGEWINNQRSTLRRTGEKVKIDVLKKYGISIDKTPEIWSANLKRATDLIESINHKENGTLSFYRNERKLYHWFTAQQKKALDGCLDWERSRYIFKLWATYDGIEITNDLANMLSRNDRPENGLDKYFKKIDLYKQSLEYEFKEALVALIDYKVAHGSADVPRWYVNSSGLKLGRWCMSIRYNHRRGLIPKSRIKRLEEIGFIFDPISDRWEKKLILCQLTLVSGSHIRFGSVTNRGFPIGGWYLQQRGKAERALTMPQKTDALNNLIIENLSQIEQDVRTTISGLGKRSGKNFKLSFDQQKFISENIDAWRELLDFFDRCGINKVPVSYRSPSGFKLGMWCSTTKINVKKGKIKDFPPELLDFL